MLKRHVAIGSLLAASLVACNSSESASEPAADAGITPGVTGPVDTAQADAASDDAAARDGGPPAVVVAPAPDYADASAWLCRPGQNGACDVDLATTIVAADGGTAKEAFVAASDPPIDCFYVYPTVSLDATPNSDLVPGPEEKAVVRAQFARFAAQCRLFAPMYRQITLGALSGFLSGAPSMADPALGFQDVLAAWQHYLAHDNAGRGVVLVGHSQGASMLTQLIKKEFDAKSEPRFISAVLAGTNVLVPKDQRVGGTFTNVPLCSAPEELGCVISFASFRDSAPPPAMSLFATSTDPKLVAGCTNPAALAGGSAELHAYLSTGGPGASSTPMAAWATSLTVDTPFVSVPGLLSAACTPAATGSYLAIAVHGDPADPRTDTISGDVVTGGTVQANWGLHLIDMHLTMGNLLDLVARKAKAYTAR